MSQVQTERRNEVNCAICDREFVGNDTVVKLQGGKYTDLYDHGRWVSERRENEPRETYLVHLDCLKGAKA